MKSAVTYDGLPVSRGGAHALGRIAARDALAGWLGFLGTCTEASSLQSWFDFPRTPRLTANPQIVRLIEAEFPRDDESSRRMSVPWERVDDALKIFESIEPLPANPWGMAPVWLWFTASFQLRSPNGPLLWPGQDPALFAHFQTPGGITLGTSSTRLILQAKRSLGLSLSIPEATDSDLETIFPWLQAALPVRLSAKNWMRWTLTRNEQSYRGRKIVPPSAGPWQPQQRS